MFIIYLLFGCLIKIGSIFHIIKVLGGSENQKIGDCVNNLSSKTLCKDFGIWLISVIFGSLSTISIKNLGSTYLTNHPIYFLKK